MIRWIGLGLTALALGCASTALEEDIPDDRDAASDHSSASDSASDNFRINHPPTLEISSAPSLIHRGQSFQATITARDEDLDSIDLSLAEGPASSRFEIQEQAPGYVRALCSWTATCLASLESYHLRFLARDRHNEQSLENSADISLTVDDPFLRGGNIYIRESTTICPGVYSSLHLYLAANNIILEGSGATLQNTNPLEGGALINLVLADGVQIRNLNLINTNEDFTLRAEGVNNGVFENLRIQAPQGIFLQDGFHNVMRGLQIFSRNSAVSCSGTHDLEVDGSVFQAGLATDRTDIYSNLFMFRNSNGLNIQDSILRNATEGLLLLNSAQIRVFNNQIVGHRYSALRLAAVEGALLEANRLSSTESCSFTLQEPNPPYTTRLNENIRLIANDFRGNSRPLCIESLGIVENRDNLF